MGIININPALPPLPRGLSFAGQFILLTGATSGIGFESARELLRHGVSKLYLPVRNLEKGEATRKTLLQDPVVIKENPDAAIELFELDLETYSSVLSFSKAFDAKVNRIDGAILNGGTATWKFTPLPAPPFNEITLQTNFLSNALLSLLLLPALERGSLSGSHKSHLLFVASIGAQKTSWEKEPFKYTPSGVVTSLNNSKNYAPFERYGMSKLFLLMWTRELAARVSSDKIIINSVCPGLTSSSIDRGLPWYAKHVVSGMRQLIARTPKQGASTYLIAISAPDAAHGSFYSDGVILKPSLFQQSPEGCDMQGRVWNESIQLLKQEYDDLRVPGT